jgi:hypothetical protein
MVDVHDGGKDDKEKSSKGSKVAALVKKKKRATITRIWIEQVGSDGTRTP